MNVPQPAGPSGVPSQMILSVPQSTQPYPVSSASIVTVASTVASTVPNAVRPPVAPPGASVVQRLAPNVVYAPIASSSAAASSSTSNAQHHRQPQNLLQQRLMGRHVRSPRLPKTKSYQKRRHTFPHRLEELQRPSTSPSTSNKSRI